ncbi:hypothetical protein EPR50_G00017410 [Perca flavescens]|uniref:Uncharacterized protein n=1 Tax=Perca flavescens TaxID=8167 RepID=A0A484DLU9_PERFV|nr:hypothetical protein EPR50_G00017410 [Perca flavescens]
MAQRFSIQNQREWCATETGAPDPPEAASHTALPSRLFPARQRLSLGKSSVVTSCALTFPRVAQPRH